MKKRKRKAKPPTQRQSQRQSVVVNIGSKSTPRKSSGRGGLPPPSHAHNLAPTFVTAPQIDYTPLLAMIQQHARPIVAQAPMPVTTTPLSASIQASTTVGPSAQQMAREAALRRAGPTAGNFQPPASEARMRPEPEPIGAPQPRPKPPVQPTPLVQPTPPLVQPTPQVRPPDPYVTQQLIKPKEAEEPGSGGGAGFKTPKRQQQQSGEKRDIKDIVDRTLKSGGTLTQAEISKAMQPGIQLGKKRTKALIKAGYTQFDK